MCLERLLLDEALEADVTLEGPDAVVDQHMPLQVGRERELPRTHVTLVALHALHTEGKGLQSTVILHPIHSCPTCGKAVCERDLLRRGETNTIHCAR